MKKIVFISLILTVFLLSGCIKIKDKAEEEPIELPPDPTEVALEQLLKSSYQPAEEPIVETEKPAEEEKPGNTEGDPSTTEEISGEYCLENTTKVGISYDRAETLAYRSQCYKKGELLGNHYCNSATGTWWIKLDIDDDVWHELDVKEEMCNPYCQINVVTEEATINWQCTGLTLGPYVVEMEKIKDEPKDYDGQGVNLVGYCTWLECMGPGCQPDFQLYQHSLDSNRSPNYMFHLKGIDSCAVGKKYQVSGLLDIGLKYNENDDSLLVKEMYLSE